MKILHVEDNLADSDLLKEAFESIGIEATVQVTHDAKKALSGLEQNLQNQGANSPDLIVLDLNLPKMDGREMLKRLKEHPQLRRIPVVILSTSNLEQDISFCYENHCNSYIVKPIRFEEYKRIAKNMLEYWFSTVALPSGSTNN
ncbi:MAG TPA: response regulator [Candidatus Melainabacteria bacterium]|nr:response regulator [Candidatus Melainabacteria bacterium]